MKRKMLHLLSTCKMNYKEIIHVEKTSPHG